MSKTLPPQKLKNKYAEAFKQLNRAIQLAPQPKRTLLECIQYRNSSGPFNDETAIEYLHKINPGLCAAEQIYASELDKRAYE